VWCYWEHFGDCKPSHIKQHNKISILAWLIWLKFCLYSIFPHILHLCKEQENMQSYNSFHNHFGIMGFLNDIQFVLSHFATFASHTQCWYRFQLNWISSLTNFIKWIEFEFEEANTLEMEKKGKV
jgi:hypothetical protein